MQEKEAIAQFVTLFMQEESLKEQIKEVADAAKESELDVSVLKAVAKAIVKGAVNELEEKSEATLQAIKVSRS